VNSLLKERMMDAAAVADKLWQVGVRKTIVDAMTEIERLEGDIARIHGVLVEVQALQAPAVEKLASLLPLLRRLEQPTEEMRTAMEDETPYFCRRAIDKKCWEVGHCNNEDWRDVISDDQTILARHADEVDAMEHYGRLEFEWRYSQMMRVAGEQPL
jgi:hypothetical protein